jgi:hypothetical protein
MQHTARTVTFAFNIAMALLVCALATVAILWTEHVTTHGQMLPFDVTTGFLGF